jgi:hypothetical protein
LRLVSETLDSEVDWDDKTRKVTILNDESKIELFIGNSTAKANNREYALDVAPKIFNDYTYVPVRFIAETLNCKVDYYHGDDYTSTDPHYFLRVPQVMISKYPTGAMSKEAALEKTREELIKAYEKKFGRPFVPIAGGGAYTDDSEIFRDIISSLKITAENDRFYVIPVIWDFWIDKYNGDIFMFYNGLTMKIFEFDPNAESALNFAG